MFDRRVSRAFFILCLVLHSLSILAETAPESGAGTLTVTLPERTTKPLTVAVAANFSSTFRKLARDFTRQTGAKVRQSAAASGVLYAQIVSGAPFDVFLSADSKSPRLLEEQGLGIAGSRFTYAVGRLALWVPGSPGASDQGLLVLESALGSELGSEVGSEVDGRRYRIAMANPVTAPYGRAAHELISRLPGDKKERLEIILGNNVNQAFQFVVSGNVPAALIAYSQLIEWQQLHPGNIQSSEIWLAPADQYQPILQQAIQINRDTRHPQASELLAFLQSAEGRGIIADHGYRLSPD